MKDKKELRKIIREENKKTLTPAYRQVASRAICQRLEELEQFQKAERIGLFHPLPDEPDLRDLLAKYGTTKELFVPRVEGKDINFYPYLGEGELVKGSFGIAEPQLAVEKAIAPSKIDLIVVPGMAFTLSGIRLGRGKAFYDRFLPKCNAFLVGTVFHFRLLQDIPSDPWDFMMNAVVTEEVTALC